MKRKRINFQCRFLFSAYFFRVLNTREILKCTENSRLFTNFHTLSYIFFLAVARVFFYHIQVQISELKMRIASKRKHDFDGLEATVKTKFSSLRKASGIKAETFTK